MPFDLTLIPLSSPKFQGKPNKKTVQDKTNHAQLYDTFIKC
ncbi:hypothetical protein ELI_0766 [Eubacterium callanderi]|uniref:Uncharacterized protein n=1 Tax=Eubacterium callanderi TaxID=53442 RepID=E3GJE5_9FIRM|nr:hypothetical protein ELI_0766 [Eubacterium callanderi]